MRRGALINLALALFALAASLALAEWLARGVRQGPMYGRILPLGGAVVRRIGDVEVWTPPEPRTKPEEIEAAARDPQRYVVLGLGDSIQYGVGLPREATYLARLQQRLPVVPGRNLYVLNLAVPGFNTRQEEAVYEEVADRLSPALVLLHYWRDDARQYRIVGGHVVDIGDLSADGRFVVRLLPWFPTLNDALLVRSRLFDVMTQARVASVRRSRASIEQEVLPSLVRLQRRVAAAGGQLVVVASADLSGTHPSSLSDVARLTEVGASAGYRVIDLGAALASVAAPEIALDGWHLNAAGHQRVAEILSPMLAPSPVVTTPR